MKCYHRLALIGVILLSFISGLMGIYSISYKLTNSGKWLSTTGLLATLAGVIQLVISEFIEKLLEPYLNSEYGPPSYIVRETIDNPDRPLATWLRNLFFFNPITGFWLIVLGTLIQVLGVWF